MSFWSFYKTTRLWVLKQKIKEKEERSRNWLKTQNCCLQPFWIRQGFKELLNEENLSDKESLKP